MFIQTENTPNPLTVKFLPNCQVMANTTADFADRDAAENAPFIQRLFNVSGVARVFLGHDFIAVTKEDGADWLSIKPLILATIMDQVTSQQPFFIPPEKTSVTYATDNPLDTVIKDLIETRIRPAVAADGGDIIFDRFERGIVYVHMQGACSGCPSSTATLKSGIENMLRHYVPDVLEVRAVD